MNQAHLPIIGMTGAVNVELQGDMLSEAFHGWVGVIFIMDRVGLATTAIDVSQRIATAVWFVV